MKDGEAQSVGPQPGLIPDVLSDSSLDIDSRLVEKGSEVDRVSKERLVPC